MEVETIGQYVASNGKNYYFFTDRIRTKEEIKSKSGIKKGKVCEKCGGTDRYHSGRCVSCCKTRSKNQYSAIKAAKE
ncbi:hypothetical protein L4K91_004507 [Salmonella enterica]|nr:hypothetical protein [Salmonella enterica]EGH6051924.1 hypothetical protein [Salmonella enterica]EIU2194127.1 hypothetical protein [Salmonella enterica]EIU2202656.1 hypothetical protein [Salmonella enterica]